MSISPPKLFISYSHNDRATAERLISCIRQHDIDYFYATADIEPGDSFPDWINRSLTSSSHFLVLLTPNSLHAEWVKLELDSAIVRQQRGQITIVPLLYGITPSDVPPLVSPVQSISVDDESLSVFTRFLQSLVAGGRNSGDALAFHQQHTRALSAVAFLHLGYLNAVAGQADYLWDDLKHRYTDLFSQYLQCNAHHRMLSVIYLYIDWGLRHAPLDKWREAGGKLSDDPVKISIEPDINRTENVLSNLIHEAIDAAKRECGLDRRLEPTFCLVRLADILDLITDIADKDSRLVGYLAGKRGKDGYRFTYDAPKFIESVIRLARGFTPHLAWNPVIRIDEDVNPNPYAIWALLSRYAEIEKANSFFFFSGRYGSPHTGTIDFVNDFAVRTHWISDPSDDREGVYLSNKRIARNFLADLSELGAAQFSGSTSYYSSEMMGLLGDREHAKPRSSPQVISGAGLIMSARAIELLPPFMNFRHNMLWVDDFLKRRLHEALGDLRENAVECISEARFKQNRHPAGIKDEDVQRASDYLPRLFRGCVFRRIISELDDEPTLYARAVKEIVFYGREYQSDITTDTTESLREEMSRLAMERGKEVVCAWKSPEFERYMHYKWAEQLCETRLKAICGDVIDNAIGYLELVRHWPVITRTIKKLTPRGNGWLFRE